MMKSIEIGLLTAVVVAVLALGGAEPSYLAAAQLTIFAAGLLLVWSGGFPVARRPYRFLLAAFVALALLVLHIRFVSVAPALSVARVLQLAACATAFGATVALCRIQASRRRIVLVLLILAGFEAFYGLIQYLAGWQQIFAYVKQFNLEEATGTYINRNHFAGFLEMTMPFSLAFAVTHARRLWSQPGVHVSLRRVFGHSDFQRTIFWLTWSVILFVALVFSRSRMGIISAVCSVVLLAVVGVASGRQRRAGVVFATFFLLAGIFTAVWIGPQPVLVRFESVGDEYSLNGQRRWDIWQDTFRLIGRHPLTGTGLGTFPVAYTSVQTAFLDRFVNHAHNDYLETLSEVGVPAGLLLVGAVLYVFWQTIRSSLSAASGLDRDIALGCVGSIGALLIHSLTDFNLNIPANSLVFAVVLGLACSSVRTLNAAGAAT